MKGSLASKDEQELLDKMCQVNCLVWAQVKNLQLRDGVSFELTGMPYLNDLVNCKKPVMHCKKGTQVCLTTTKFIESVHACVYRKYAQNVLYMMPTINAVQKLSTVSFSPIFKANGWLKKMVSTDTALIKTINGRSIVFTGAQPQSVDNATSTKDSINLRSIPADCIKRDEIDLMDSDMIDMSHQRLNRSKFGIEENFGSPTCPDFGIDALYENSTKGKWQIKCSSCGKHTCLPESFPNSIILKDGRWIRACIHCHNEIFVNDGQWIHEYPDRRELGFWIDSLMTPIDRLLESFMFRYHNANPKQLLEFSRSILGIAAIEAENQLSQQDVYANCNSEQMCLNYTDSETAMGFDVDPVMHAVIGIRTGKDTYEILRMVRADEFSQLHDIAKAMNVKYCVEDAMPDIHASREFQKTEPYKIWRCFYSEFQTSAPDFDNEKGTIKCNRNEMCDKVHDVFVNNKITIPRRTPEIETYAYQMTRTAKVLMENPDTGQKKPKWIKKAGKEDHYFHATLYFLLAASKLMPVKKDGSLKNTRYFRSKNNFHI